MSNWLSNISDYFNKTKSFTKAFGNYGIATGFKVENTYSYEEIDENTTFEVKEQKLNINDFLVKCELKEHDLPNANKELTLQFIQQMNEEIGEKSSILFPATYSTSFKGNHLIYFSEIAEPLPNGKNSRILPIGVLVFQKNKLIQYYFYFKFSVDVKNTEQELNDIHIIIQKIMHSITALVF